MDFDTEAMARVLNVPSEKFRDKMVSSLKDYMTTIRRELGDRAPSREEATQALVDAFAALIGEPVVADHLTDRERERLAYYRARLFDPAFVYRHEGYLQPGVKIKDGVRLLEGIAKSPGGLVRVVWRESEGRIDDIVIGGDFFVNPADGLSVVQQGLRGQPAEGMMLRQALGPLWAALDVPGVSVDDVVMAFEAGHTVQVMEAVE